MDGRVYGGGERYAFAGLAAAGVTLSNGLMHTINSITLGEYNPGLATSLLLFLPGASWYLYRAHRVVKINRWLIGGGIAYGLLGHVTLLPLSVLLDTPIWLLAGFAAVPLIVNVLVMLHRSGNSRLTIRSRQGSLLRTSTR